MTQMPVIMKMNGRHVSIQVIFVITQYIFNDDRQCDAMCVEILCEDPNACNYGQMGCGEFYIDYYIDEMQNIVDNGFQWVENGSCLYDEDNDGWCPIYGCTDSNA